MPTIMTAKQLSTYDCFTLVEVMMASLVMVMMFIAALASMVPLILAIVAIIAYCTYSRTPAQPTA